MINASKEPAVEAVRRATGGRGVNRVFECSGAPNAVNDAIKMVTRGGRVCLGAFSQQPVLAARFRVKLPPLVIAGGT